MSIKRHRRFKSRLLTHLKGLGKQNKRLHQMLFDMHKFGTFQKCKDGFNNNCTGETHVNSNITTVYAQKKIGTLMRLRSVTAKCECALVFSQKGLDGVKSDAWFSCSMDICKVLHFSRLCVSSLQLVHV